MRVKFRLYRRVEIEEVVEFLDNTTDEEIDAALDEWVLDHSKTEWTVTHEEKV